MSGGLAQSVQVRLITHAQTIGQDPNLVLSRYAIERLLFRLSVSPHADRFVLKGAFMLLVWLGESLRPTRDADVLGFGDLGADAIRNTFADICSIEVAPDGLTFDIDSIRVAPIRHEDAYVPQGRPDHPYGDSPIPNRDFHDDFRRGICHVPGAPGGCTDRRCACARHRPCQLATQYKSIRQVQGSR